MFEFMNRSVDSTRGMWVGAFSGCAETAALLAQRGAEEGQNYAGPAGGVFGGAVGWAYGSIAGLCIGAFLGTMRGADYYAAKESPAATSPPEEKPISEGAATAKQTASVKEAPPAQAAATANETPVAKGTSAAKTTAGHPKKRKRNKPAMTN